MSRIQIALLFLVVLIGWCCEFYEKTSVPENSIKSTDELPISQIHFSDSFKIYDPFNVVNFNKFVVNKKPLFRIYAYLNVSCSNCLVDLNKWASISKLHNNNLYEARVVCFSKDNFLYFTYLYEEGEIKKCKFPFYLDKNGAFARDNPIFTTYNKNPMVLTDLEDNIMMIGDPLNIMEDRKKFISYIIN